MRSFWGRIYTCKVLGKEPGLSKALSLNDDPNVFAFPRRTEHAIDRLGNTVSLNYGRGRTRIEVPGICDKSSRK